MKAIAFISFALLCPSSTSAPLDNAIPMQENVGRALCGDETEDISDKQSTLHDCVQTEIGYRQHVVDRRVQAPEQFVEDIEAKRDKRALGDRWKTTNIKYFVHKYPKSAVKATVEKAIFNAFIEWERASALLDTEFTFHPTRNVHEANIKFEFPESNGIHDKNCGKPFADAKNVIAHCIYPRNGTIHYSANENWNEYDFLYYVTLHEIGHAIGLPHNEDESSIMYETHKNRGRILNSDLDRLEELYGLDSNRKKPTGEGERDTYPAAQPSGRTAKEKPREAEVCVDGRFRAKSIAKDFDKCDHGNWVPFTCGMGTVFNPRHNICDYPYNVLGTK